MARLGDVCEKVTSNILQKDLEGHNGSYPIYGASGFIANVDFYQQEKPYIAVVKDGAGIGRIMKLPAKSSVIGTMQYIIPNDAVDISYLAYAMEHMNLSKYFTGATIPHIYFKDYQREEFLLPPLDEQRKIAAVLDKVSDLIAKRRQQLNKLDELVKSRFIEMFGDPKDNSNGWPVLPLGKLFTVSSSKRIYQSEQTSSGIPFLRISDLVQRMDERTVTAELYISEQHYAALKKEGLVPVAGDILVTSRGTLGRCYEIKEDDRFYFQDGMISWLFDKKPMVTNTYIMQLFQMPGFRKQIDDIPAGSTVNYLSLARLKELRVMCPTIELQEQFIAFVEQVDKSKLAVQQGLQELEILKKSLMQEYFE